MKHKGSITLETERLILRKFEISDANCMYNNWASDDLVTKYLRWPTHSSIDVTNKVLGMWVNDNERLTNYQWAIILKEINEPIGSIGAVDMNDKLDMIHIGYAIGRKWWGQGITAEALNKLIEFFFNDVEAQRIESMHDPNNPNSGRVMKKCGMKYEGTHKKADWNNQGICDASYYAILKSEYYNKI